MSRCERFGVNATVRLYDVNPICMWPGSFARKIFFKVAGEARQISPPDSAKRAICVSQKSLY